MPRQPNEEWEKRSAGIGGAWSWQGALMVAGLWIGVPALFWLIGFR